MHLKPMRKTEKLLPIMRDLGEGREIGAKKAKGRALKCVTQRIKRQPGPQPFCCPLLALSVRSSFLSAVFLGESLSPNLLIVNFVQQLSIWYSVPVVSARLLSTLLVHFIMSSNHRGCPPTPLTCDFCSPKTLNISPHNLLLKSPSFCKS